MRDLQDGFESSSSASARSLMMMMLVSSLPHTVCSSPSSSLVGLLILRLVRIGGSKDAGGGGGGEGCLPSLSPLKRRWVGERHPKTGGSRSLSGHEASPASVGEGLAADITVYEYVFNSHS